MILIKGENVIFIMGKWFLYLWKYVLNYCKINVFKMLKWNFYGILYVNFKIYVEE